MNILAVHPPYPGNKQIVYLPLGLGYTTAVAEREGHEVTVLDMHNLRLSYDVLEKTLARREFQACFMGGFAMQVKGMAKVTELIKKVQPDCKVILGGVGVSDIPEIALNYTRADIVSNGEAENVLPPLLKAIEERRACEDLPGFVYRRGGDIIKQARAAAPDDLDALPYPAYHLFDVDYISTKSYNGRGPRSLHLMTSRGCPFKCNFCINSVLNNRTLLKEIHGKVEEEAAKSQRFRSVGSLAKEIEFLRSRYGITDFHFADEEFITHRRRLEEVCQAIEPLGISWSTSGRADWATEDKLHRMKKAGCTYVLFGVETGSQTLLDLMDKNAKKPAVTQGLISARKVGMDFIANFMVGHPGETESTIRETVDFCKEHKLIFLPAFVTLFPNSKMFHDFAKNITDWDWYFKTLSTIDFNRNLLVNLTKMPQKKLLAMRNWAVAETFSTMLAPKLTGVLHQVLTKLLTVALVISDRCPNSLRMPIRNAIRAIFGRTTSKITSDGSDRSMSTQVPPNEYGQSELPDAYEESLRELTAPPRK